MSASTWASTVYILWYVSPLIFMLAICSPCVIHFLTKGFLYLFLLLDPFYLFWLLFLLEYCSGCLLLFRIGCSCGSGEAGAGRGCRWMLGEG